jgi:menaquinone-9 beta-reductase
MITITPLQHYDCDVLIAGGGPAGSGLAYHLAKQGFKVIVAEAEKFPRDKVCGDGVSPVALAELHAMGITQTDAFAKANEIDKVGLFIKDDQVFVDIAKPDYLPFHARIIPRMELDNWIYEAAKKAGAVYYENTRVQSFSTTAHAATAVLKKGCDCFTVTAKLIAGADGSRSTIARQIHGAKPSDEFQLLGLRAYYENVNGPNNRVDIYFSGESFPGIFWMFPKGPKGANIGMAMVSQTLPQKPSHVRDLLAQHIAQNPDIGKRIGNGKPTGKIDGWPINFFNASNTLTANRVILVGDAAGLINPLSGDGIQYALLSARWAAATVSECLPQNDVSETALYNYRKKIDAELGYDFALSNLLVQFARNKTLTPVWMNILKVMIAQAKEDKEYAATIAGIFEGTYPSYKALTPGFIINSLLQGVKTAGSSIATATANPTGLPAYGMTQISNVLQVIQQLGAHTQVQGGWLKNTVGKTLTVAGYVIQHLVKGNSRTV